MWSSDYTVTIAKRIQWLQKIESDVRLIKQANEHYKTHPIDFINQCCVTVDPRLQRTKTVPFILFEKQKEFARYFQSLLEERENGLTEKCRDMGVSWECCALAVWMWRYIPDSSIGFGSSKEIKVDKIGDLDSIFEKIRRIILCLPWWVLPGDFNPRTDLGYMKIVNRENGSIIKGEAGDNIGRGGRSTVYFKDEAQPLDEPVLTPNGWRKIGDLKIGDKVFSPIGKSIKVLGINDCGIHQVYKIILNDGSITHASENHKWLLHSGKEVRTKDLFEKHKRIYGTQVQYPLYLPSPIITENKDFPLHPYVVGALLGDGSVIKKFGITSNDPEIPQRINSLLPNGSRIEKRQKYWWQILSSRRGKGIKGSARIGAEMAGIWGMKCNNKFIPQFYKHAGYELLRGLMDTDGSYSNGTSLFVNSSIRLCHDVMDLVRSLGGRSSIRKRNDGTWAVYVRTPECPFWLPRKANAWKRKQKCERAIVEVIPIGEMPVRCITVEDNLYITRDYIVTHNSAHYDRPEKIEAALSMNTDVQLDVSSVNGAGNVFYRRRMAGQIWMPEAPKIDKGVTRVFIFDWRDDPRKTQEWYDIKRRKYESEGLLHVFAQEVDRDYFSAVEKIIINQDWVKAAIDADKALGLETAMRQGEKICAQDVADGGSDRNASAAREGVVLMHLDQWSGLAEDAAKRTLPLAIEHGWNPVFYDSIGVGVGFRAQSKLMQLPKSLKIIPWDASGAVLDPTKPIIPTDAKSPKNEDHFKNMKAQGWWRLRTRFYKTFRAVRFGDKYDPSELISLPSTLTYLHQLCMELSQPTYDYDSSGKMLVDKKPDGTMSPNLADSLMMCYCPIRPPVGVMQILG